jgi:hypothetical protein
MPGDYSRETFDPRHHYAGVLMQQGRVQMDADWNEQQGIHQHREETQARDVIGACGAPLEDGGFALELLDDGRDLRISPGRIYVDGILGALDSEEVRAHVLAGEAKQLQLDSLFVDGYPLAAGAWIELRDAALPLAAPQLFQVSTVDPAKAQLTLKTAGVGLGAALALRRVVTFLTQPDYPHPGIDSDPTPLTALPADRYLAYLDVWQREVTALEVPHLRETALGGPDTATRLKTVCQVRLLKLADSLPAELDCTVPLPQWDDLTIPPCARMNARTREAPPDQNPCQLPPTAGYRRLENQLYRIQIHDGGLRSAATFKWSRDNGSVETGVEQIDTTDGRKVWVTSTGPDEASGFRAGDWVELLDAAAELKGTPHPLAHITGVSPEQNLITLDRDVGKHRGTVRKLRRWDQSTADAVNDQGLIPLEAGGGDATNPRWVELEGGIEVHFEDADATYRSGDYWLIPARTFSGEIEWPPFETPNRHPLPQPPHGICHHYCRLALVDTGPATRKVQDCRCRFPALNQAQGVCYVSGDGQEVMPVPPFEGGRLAGLPHPLVVGVLNPQGCPHPARVRFVIRKGTGRLHALKDAAAAFTEIVLKTNPSGLVECWWDLGADFSSEDLRAGNLPSQQVEAQLLDEQDQPVQKPIRFNANLSVAQEVAYDATGCTGLVNCSTVQNALETLSGQASLHKVSGDAQIGTAGAPLPRPLVVLVASRCGPVVNHTVQWSVLTGGGSMTSSPEPDAKPGEASCRWTLGNSPDTQEVEAELKAPASMADPVRVRFTAHLRAAADDSGMQIVDVKVGSKREPLANDSFVSLPELAQGLFVTCDRAVDPKTIDRPTVFVQIDVPHPLGENQMPPLAYHPHVAAATVSVPPDAPNEVHWIPSRRTMEWLSQQVVTTPILTAFLAPSKDGMVAEVRFCDPPSFDTNSLVVRTGADPIAVTSVVKEGECTIVRLLWPTAAESDLQFSMSGTTQGGSRWAITIPWLPFDNRVLARLILKGNSIWAEGDGGLCLDGDCFRSMNPQQLALPSGDSRRGGDFQMLFWLVNSPDITPKLTDVTPKLTDVTPKLTDVTPKLTDVTPKVTDVTPKVTDVTPKVTDVTPKVTDVTPKVTDVPKRAANPTPHPAAPTGTGKGKSKRLAQRRAFIQPGERPPTAPGRKKP